MIMIKEEIKKSFLVISPPPFRGKHLIILPIVLFIFATKKVQDIVLFICLINKLIEIV